MAGVARGALERMVKRVDGVSVFSPTARRLMQLTRDKSADVSKIAHLAERDPALATRMLKYANSPYIGLPRQVRELQTAIRVLGFDGVHDMALALSVGRVIENAGGAGQLLWEHMVWSKAIAEQLSRVTRVLPRGQAGTLGLVYDVGWLLLLVLEPRKTRALLRQMDPTEPNATLEAEEEVFGFTHVDLGAEVLRRWKLPTDVTAAVFRHHDPHSPLPGAKLLRMVDRLDYLVMHGLCDEIVLDKALSTETPLTLSATSRTIVARWLEECSQQRKTAKAWLAMD